VAKATGNRLLLAGNISALPEEKRYFETEIQPHIDGRQIEYVGPLNDAQKNQYLGRAKALLFPIEWNEPFGMVMVEAMACGTPVIAFNKGSVPEVVENNITGYVVSDADEMKIYVNKVYQLSRAACRESAKARFDVSEIAKQYLSLLN
jgi:glycosyltransferase involved in cell wall biosynthesis